MDPYFGLAGAEGGCLRGRVEADATPIIVRQEKDRSGCFPVNLPSTIPDIFSREAVKLPSLFFCCQRCYAKPLIAGAVKRCLGGIEFE